ncbi:PREDICTED: transmembrane protein 54 isoform X2 [Capra hircus]|uniref:transmembrane protein 54 isoform X2 n=1 Tax=Capra hircus TaxID=9925 RepID=UPI000847928F|nr:PREDICTED: transmembrane protein 54 isoform X2 [Capra hircus]
MCLRLGGLSVGDFRKVLMKTGLVLVVLGHVSFIAAALLHGTVLRYVAAPNDAVALQYCVVDILSVTSAIVRWTVFSLSVACALLSLTCALGLLASIAVTFATQGRALLAACTFGGPERLALAPDCPFDPTRIYSSSLCLWGISLLFCVAESVFAVRSAQLAHQVLELRPWLGKSSHRVGPYLENWGNSLLPQDKRENTEARRTQLSQMQESPEPVEDLDLPSRASSGPMTL